MDIESSVVVLLSTDIRGVELSKPWEQHTMVAL